MTQGHPIVPRQIEDLRVRAGKRVPVDVKERSFDKVHGPVIGPLRPGLQPGSKGPGGRAEHQRKNGGIPPSASAVPDIEQVLRHAHAHARIDPCLVLQQQQAAGALVLQLPDQIGAALPRARQRLRCDAGSLDGQQAHWPAALQLRCKTGVRQILDHHLLLKQGLEGAVEVKTGGRGPGQDIPPEAGGSGCVLPFYPAPVAPGFNLCAGQTLFSDPAECSAVRRAENVGSRWASGLWLEMHLEPALALRCQGGQDQSNTGR